MQDIYELKEEVLYLQNFQRIIETYQEIAASRMQRVKDSVLHNREYLDETRSIYHEVLSSYDEYVQKLIKMSDSIETRKNGKSVTILLSSNTKLYGPIINKIFLSFQKDIQSKTTDVVIVGKTGLQLYNESRIQKEYTYFDLPDDIVTPDALGKIIDFISPYREITVFHGQFQDMLSQIVKSTAITPEIPLQNKNVSTSRVGYIFEPSISDVLLYFEKEILGSLFVQTVNESNLSKFTSRMITLNNTNDNIKKEASRTSLRMNVAKHRRENKKQQDQLSSLAIWTA